ncbi:hypothetical protein DyAD56_16255 [Dyella sp. AD56]|nr:hypothetical protein DyAD56_16255 [Dyella sp. AD56]
MACSGAKTLRAGRQPALRNGPAANLQRGDALLGVTEVGDAGLTHPHPLRPNQV